MNKDKIQASIIIPTHNRCESLARTIHSAINQDFPKEQYEVIIVDNKSKDDTDDVYKKLCKDFQNLIIVKEEKLSFTAARHAGAKAAQGAYLCFTDDDVALSSNWLAEVIKTFQLDPEKIGIVTGPIYPRFEQEPPIWAMVINNYLNGFSLMMDKRNVIHEINFAFGPNFSIRERFFWKVEGFPPDTIGIESDKNDRSFKKLYLGSGDMGLSLKMIKKGYKIMYNPEAYVFHIVPPTRLTKKWWEDRFRGEACYHSLHSQYLNNYSRGNLKKLALFYHFKSFICIFRFLLDRLFKITETDLQLYKYYYMNSRAKLMHALSADTSLLGYFSKIGLEGLAEDEAIKLTATLEKYKI